jgi:hypothetical protein
MEAPEVWVASDDGTEIIRAQAIAAVVLDYNGNVSARLGGYDGTVVTLVAHREHHDEARPGDLHRALLRVVAQLGRCTTRHAAGSGSASRSSSQRNGVRRPSS